MARFGSPLATAVLLLATSTAFAQPTHTMDYTLQGGWHFNGSPYLQAEASIHGVATTALSIDCSGTGTRIFVDFRVGPPPIKLNGASSQQPSTQAASITFTFVKHSFASAVTASLDTTQEKTVAAKLYTSTGVSGGPAMTERIIIDGPAAQQILPLLKTMDEVSASVRELGQPISFSLADAADAIDKLLPVCAAGS